MEVATSKSKVCHHVSCCVIETPHGGCHIKVKSVPPRLLLLGYCALTADVCVCACMCVCVRVCVYVHVCACHVCLSFVDILMVND